MTTTSPGAFVQVGATRDGLDPYLDAARRRGMPAVLIETPAYLGWRQQLGRRPFDLELPVEHPADAAQVRRMLETRGVDVALLLAGFERYVGSAFTVAAALEHGPRRRWPDGPFDPVDKRGQRDALARHRPDVLQPRHASFAVGAPEARSALTRMGFPLVVKPSNGGGGLGVFFVEDAAQGDRALATFQTLANYDGAPFERVLLEEFIEGTEHSIQGLAYEGHALILTTCEKFIHREPSPDGSGLHGFREVGHMATHGDRTSPALRTLVQACLDATGYREGPFHVDVIQGGRGAFFVEMGFRLSGGGIVALVEKTIGVNWAELVFETHLGERVPRLPPSREGPGVYVGQVTCTCEEELRAGEALCARGVKAEVQRLGPVRPATQPPRRRGEKTLASDKLRHTGFAGRITVRGSTLGEVHHLLQGCIAARLGV